MRPYQEEYLRNIGEIADLSRTAARREQSFSQYAAGMRRREEQAARLVKRNMELLRGQLFPMLDDLPQAGEEELDHLRDFAAHLLDPVEEVDGGLFCQIRQALLIMARQKRDRQAMIRELYWMGLGRYSQQSKLVGLEYPVMEPYVMQMRLCFTEAAAYLKYYDEIEDSETRGYILRARANMALGQFKSPGERIGLVRQTLRIMQDKDYQKKAPDLPWDRFIRMTHQHMVTSISYSRKNNMTAEDMASILESAYLIYQPHMEGEGGPPSLRWAFPYYAIEYYCGIHDLDWLLTQAEALMDRADRTDFSAEGMYGVVSLPAFYCQFLRQYPEQLADRREYVDSLYLRLMDYMETFPDDRGGGSLFQYLRQLSHTFVETGGQVSYGDFLQKLILRFAPGVYLHSYMVGEGAKALCRVILAEEPAFFDDIPDFQAMEPGEEKTRAILDYAGGCGAFHDAGKINFLELYTRPARQWFEEEYQMARLHAVAGETLLAARPSTRRYAPVALGHHAWYDGARGYPESYRRLDTPCRQMVDLIGLVDWLENVTHSARVYTGEEMTFSQAVEAAIALEGKRFSPLLTARLRDKQVAEAVGRAFEEGRQEAYRRMYADACRDRAHTDV